MIEIFFILLIFIEIALTYFIVLKIFEFEKRIIVLNQEIVTLIPLIKEIHKKIQNAIHQTNRVIKIITNKNLWQIKKIIGIIIDTIQILILIRSFNFKKGIAFNLKNIKNLIFANATKELLFKLFKTIQNTCN